MRNISQYCSILTASVEGRDVPDLNFFGIFAVSPPFFLEREPEEEACPDEGLVASSSFSRAVKYFYKSNLADIYSSFSQFYYFFFSCLQDHKTCFGAFSIIK